MNANNEPLNLDELQDEVRDWHREKYPRATLAEIGLKLAEETGEVCRAIDRIIYAKSQPSDEEWRRNLTDEIGDCGIVLLALAAKGGLSLATVIAERWDEVIAR